MSLSLSLERFAFGLLLGVALVVLDKALVLLYFNNISALEWRIVMGATNKANPQVSGNMAGKNSVGVRVCFCVFVFGDCVGVF